MNPTVLKIIVWFELIVFFIPVLAWPLLAFMSLFTFDAPGSEKNSILLSLVAIALGYPLLYGFSAVMAIKHLKLSNGLQALIYSSLPILAFALFGLLLWLLEVKCKGNFSC